MSKDAGNGEIDPAKHYNAERLRGHMNGVSLRRCKDFIREYCVYSEPFEGALSVLGADFITALAEIGTTGPRRPRKRKPEKNEEQDEDTEDET